MDCGSATVKYLLFIFNLVFCLGGVALLIIGSIIQWNIDKYGSLFPGHVSIPGILLIIVGGVTFLVALIGCLGAVKESHCMIIAFAVSLVSIFILQVTGGILAIVYQSELAGILEESMQRAMELYPLSGEDSVAARRSWDRVQKNFRCCGIKDPWEWIRVPGMKDFPDSCKCNPLDVRCVEGIFVLGCYKDLSAWLIMVESILGGVAIGLALVGAIFAISLASAVRRRMHTV